MNRKPKIALISIGQTPRPDITTDYRHMVCDKFDIVEFGALDDCDTKTIEELRPLSGDADLVTRLADGSPIQVSHGRLTPYVQQAVNRAQEDNATVAVVQCTGHFALHTKLCVIYPAAVLEKNASILAGRGKSVFLLIPTSGQTTEAELRWRSRGYSITAIQVISPFATKQTDLDSLKHTEALAKADMLIADCYGFTNAFYQQIRTFYNGPILLPRRLIAHLLINVWQ